LCNTCYNSFNLGNNKLSKDHSSAHDMEQVDLSNNPAPPPPPPTNNTPVDPVCLTYDVLVKSAIYVTGKQLGIVIPPKLTPNKFDTYICRGKIIIINCIIY
jgi:hypothetical protein